MPTPFSLGQWLSRFADELNDLGQRNALGQDWFTTGRGIPWSWLHARVLGALSRSIDRPHVPLHEVKWPGGFCPDLCVVDEADQVVAVIEYESTNSSDERLMGKDLEHYEEAILSYAPGGKQEGDQLPPWWIIISTLPKKSVKGWKWYGWNKDKKYPPRSKNSQHRNNNPYNYYEAGLRSEIGEVWRRLRRKFKGDPPCNIVWVNLTPTSLDVEEIVPATVGAPQNSHRLVLPQTTPLAG